jgi:hypothetical protein
MIAVAIKELIKSASRDRPSFHSPFFAQEIDLGDRGAESALEAEARGAFVAFL